MLRTQMLLIAVAVLPTALSLMGDLIPPPRGEDALYYLLHYIPFFFVGLTALLGIRLNQTRIFLASLLLLLAYALLTTLPIPAFFSATPRESARALSITVPLGLILLFLNRESPLPSPKGALMTVFALGPPVGTLLGYKLGTLEAGFFSPEATRFVPSFWNLPEVALVGIILLLIQSAFLRRTHIENFTRALAIGLIPLFSALNAVAAEPAVTAAMSRFVSLNFIALSILLFYGIYSIYWQRIYIDELTGAYNRRAFDEALQRLRGSYSIAMIDIDHFKRFNDTYGHGAGDDVLRFVAKSLESDAGARVYRYGGEEFSILFDRECDQGLVAFADSVRKRIAGRAFYIRAPQSIRRKRSRRYRGKQKLSAKSVRITISVGLAGITKNQRKSGDVVKAADKALYRAKTEGRNRVVAG